MSSFTVLLVVFLVQNPNVVKITDFGLAKLLGSNEDVFKAAGGKVSLMPVHPCQFVVFSCI